MGDPSPFMLMTCQVRKDKQALVPASTHVDDTMRVQTVDAKTNPRYHAMLRAFEAKTGVPVVLNTSFNENEPIVCTPEDAVSCFMETGMDLLVMGDRFVTRA